MTTELLKGCQENLDYVMRIASDNAAMVRQRDEIIATKDQIIRQLEARLNVLQDPSDARCMEIASLRELNRKLANHNDDLSNQIELLGDQVRRDAKELFGIRSVLDAADIPTNGPDGEGKRQELTPTQRVLALRLKAEPGGLALVLKQRDTIDALRAEVEDLTADCDSWQEQASDRLADWEATHAELIQLRERVATLFDKVKHGDDAHQAWLKSFIDDHFGLTGVGGDG
jgi:FtsZ-binding cell division protein ZapB